MRLPLAHILVLSGAIFLVGCQSLRVDDARRQIAVDWRSAERTHAYDYEITPPFEIAWSYNASAGFGPGTPLIIGDAVLVGGRNGELHAVKLDSGRRIGMRRLDESIEGTPAFERGVVYVTHAAGRKTVRAIDLDRGTERWTAKVGAIDASPVLVGDVLVVANSSGTIRGLDKSSGASLWLVDREAPIQSSPILMSGGRLVIADTDGLVRAIRALDGSIVWQFETGLPVYEALSRSAGGEVIVPTTRGAILAIGAESGEMQWQTVIGTAEERVTAAAVDDDLVIAGTTAGTVSALDLVTGKMVWTQMLDEGIAAPPAIVGDLVLVASLGRQLVTLSRSDGSIVDVMSLNGRIKSAIVATDQGILVLVEPRNMLLLSPVEEEVEDAP